MRTSFAAAAIAAALFQQAPPQIRVAVNMTTIESAPVFLAAQNAKDVRIDLTSGGIPLLLDGGADAATNSETQALIRSVSRPDLRIIMTVSECAYRIVARRSAGIKTLGDLRGKRIGTPANTSSAYYLSKALERATLKESDVTIVAVTVPDMPAAMKRGALDAISGWEPAAQDSIKALGADAIAFQPPGLYRELFDLNTTTAVLNDPARRQALVRAVRAMIDGSTKVRTEPASVWPLLFGWIKVPILTTSAAWNQFRFNAWIPDDAVNVLVEEDRWVAAIQKRAPRTRAQLQVLLDDSVLKEARQQIH